MKTIVKLLFAVAVSVAVISCGDSLLPTEPAASTSGLKLHADELTGPTLSTDRLDYPPGDTVTIYGSGWQPDETITLLLTEDAEIHEPLQWEVQADALGNFTDSSFIVEEHDLGVKFTLTATGASGSTVQTSFTDGNFNVKTNAGTMTVSWQLFSSTNCTTGGGAITTGVPVGTNNSNLVNAVATQSVQVIITANPAGTTFLNWTGPSTVTNTTLCSVGAGGGGVAWIANFSEVTTTTVTANKASPQEFGTSVTFTAQVNTTASGTPAVGTGTVTFYDGGSCSSPGPTLQAATAVSPSGGTKGSVAFTTTSLSVAAHTVLACYTGAPAYEPSSNSMAFTINDIATSTVVTANQSSPQEVGASIIFTATVTRANGPANVAVTTGSIVFYDGGTCVSPGAELQPAAPVSGTGTKTFTTSSLSIAAHTILACFTPPANFAASSGTLAFTITQIATTTTVTSDLTSPRPFGTSVVFTAEVNRTTGGTDVLSGNVVFYDGGSCVTPGTTLQVAQAVDGTTGKVTYATSTLSAGDHTVLACYLGTTDYATSSGTKAFTISSIPTTTVITALPVSPSELGTPVTFTATVTRTTGGAAVTAGQVKFVEGGNCSATELQAAANLNGSGQVTFMTSALAVGGHNIRACYLPPAEYIASDDAINYMIAKIGTTSTLTADKTSPQDFGTSIVFTAEVNRTTGGADVTEGTFTFYDGGTDCTTTGTLLQAAATVDGAGKVTLTTSTLSPGVHTIFACYGGTPTYRGSTASMSFTINAIPTTTAIAALPVSPSELGTSVTFTATVTRTTGGAAVTVGQVKFVEGANCSATEVQAAVNVDGSGQATFITSTLGVGGHTIRACYLPTAEYVASNNAITYTIVNVATTSTLIADKTSPQSFGTSIVFTAEVNRTTGGADVTVGTFTFYDGGTDCTTTGTLLQAATTVDGVGKATLTTSALNPGAHTIFACYTGAAQYISSTASMSFTINVISTTTTLTVTPSTQQYSDKVTLSAAILPTTAPGSVQFQKNVNSGGWTDIGSAVTVVSGAASYDYTVVESSTDVVQLKAVFTSSSVGYSGSAGTGSLTVTKEDATVTFDASNLAAMQVSSPGGTLNAGALSMKVLVTETVPDLAAATAAAGNIANAGLTVTLTPIGGGSAITLSCGSGVVTGTGYAGVKTYTCTNSAALVVNAYEVNAAVTGNYYAGSGVDAFTVYDPSLGFATGGGHFSISGDKVTFGFVMKYNKGGTNLQGNFLAVRHLAGGKIAKIKSNSLGALALTDNGCGVASFDGKATYTYWLGGVYVNTGNNAFTVYAEDCNNPGTGVDKIWMSGPSLLNIASPVSTNKTALTGGNISVPHTPKP